MRPLPGMSAIAEFSTRFDADVAVARLAEAGFEAVVLGDPSHSVAPHHVVDRTFSVVVREEVAEHASSILSDDRPPDREADALDALYHQRRFADRPTWVRWGTWAVLAGVAGPVAIAALIQLLVVVRGLFP